jgi:hypothetical protein
LERQGKNKVMKEDANRKDNNDAKAEQQKEEKTYYFAIALYLAFGTNLLN